MSRITPPTRERRTVCEVLHLDSLRRRGVCRWMTKVCCTDGDVKREERIRQQRDAKMAALKKRKDFIKKKAATKLQAGCRKWKAQKEYQAKRKAAMKFQSTFKGWKARRDFTRFMTEDNPPLSVVQSFCHLLNPADITIQENELNKLKREICEKIETTQQQRQELSDIQKDATTLQEGCADLRNLVSRFRKVKRENREEIIYAIINKRKRAFYLKRKKQIIASYERLLYHLQTEPVYLSRLISCPHMNDYERRITDRVLAALYDNVSSQREEYHLMNLVKATLHEEIQKKCKDSIQYEDLTILKTIIKIYTKGECYTSLLQALKPAHMKILRHTSSSTLSYAELTNRIHKTFEEPERLHERHTAKGHVTEEDYLCVMTDQIVKSILSSAHLIPYGVRYTARILQQTLQENLPWADEDAILNTVGTFLHNWLMPALKNPLGSGFGPKLDLVQKENLKAVSELIHMTMDTLHCERVPTPEVEDYIKKNKPSLRKFCSDVMKVPEPGEYLGLNRFSDATAMKKPVINMLAADIIFTHVLLTRNVKDVFPDKKDVAYQMLKSIEPIPELEHILDFDDSDSWEKPEIRLHLFRTLNPQEQWDSEIDNLVTTTRKLIMDVIRVQPGETVHDVLTTPATPAQEEEHKTFMRDTTFIYPPSEGTNSHLLEDHHLPLEDKKKKIQRNMEIIRRASPGEDKMEYETFLNQVYKEIKMKHELRKQRESDITMLREAAHKLDLLSNYLNDLIDLQKKHIDVICHQSHTEIQYTAKDLYRRGVILHTYGKQKDLKREVLTIKLDDGNIHVQLGNICALLPVLDLLKLYKSNNRTMNIFHYEVHIGLFLFLVWSNICRV